MTLSSSASAGPLIITGMHRSATSFVANLLQSAGLDIGNQLVGPAPGNPRGHYEDRDFVEFHNRCLEVRSVYLYTVEGFKFEPTSEELTFAGNLVSARSNSNVWGWKDPRTVLFLDFWKGLLPSAKFLFLYRHPLEVVWSLLRRGEPLSNLQAGIRAWVAYNQRILDFIGAYPQQSILCQCWAVGESVEEFSRCLDRFDLPLDLTKAVFESVWQANDLRKLSAGPDALAVFDTQFPEAAGLYVQLEQSATLPASAQSAPDHSIALPEPLKLLGKTPSSVNAEWLLRALLAHLDPLGTRDGQLAMQSNLESLHHRRTREHLDALKYVASLQKLVSSREAELETLTVNYQALESAIQQERVNFQRERESIIEHLHAAETYAKSLEELKEKLQFQTASLENAQNDLEAQWATDHAALQNSLTEAVLYSESLGKLLSQKDDYIAELKEQIQNQQNSHKQELETIRASIVVSQEYINSLESARSIAEKHAQNLEEDRVRLKNSLLDAQGYAQSLEKARREAEEYAKSLEEARLATENYAANLKLDKEEKLQTAERDRANLLAELSRATVLARSKRHALDVLLGFG